MVRVKGNGYSNEHSSVVLLFHVTQLNLKFRGRQGNEEGHIERNEPPGYHCYLPPTPVFSLLGLSTASQDHITGNHLFYIEMVTAC